MALGRGPRPVPDVAAVIRQDHRVTTGPATTTTAPPGGRGRRLPDRAERAELRTLLLPLVTLAGLAAGVVAAVAGADAAADILWAATAAVVLVPLVVSVGSSLRHGDVGVDVIALIAIAAALALGEYLPAAVVALMLSGGNALEQAANRRSRRELTALLARAPRTARVRRGDHLVEVPVAEVRRGDDLVVRPGEVLPVDGVVSAGEALVDEAALTGESIPVRLEAGGGLRSGTTNAGGPIEMRAERPAAESAYAAIVRLVAEAASQRAPFVRMADRYAVGFLVFTLLLAGGAWLASGDPVRALAVLVVATPCPLILAAPIAFVAGVSRAARRGIIVKGSGVIEGLGRAGTVLLDKTGTLTIGHPDIARITPEPGWSEDEVLRVAASLECLSAHVLADAVAVEARARGLAPAPAGEVRETAGRGIEGMVEGRRVLVGSGGWLGERGVEGAGPNGGAADGRAVIRVGVDGALAGTISMADHVRPDAGGMVPRLRAAGVSRIAMITGDEESVAREVAARVGVDEVHAGQSPQDKLGLVRDVAARGDGGVIMVGDGVNDAPALALADVGIAMGSAGATASSQAADAVIAVDRIDRVAEAVEIGRRSLRIARQSVLVGIGLSSLAMVAAALGYLPPLAGALLQEVIDVAVILNALRALRG
jgi:heavy metal translocating P-type ATPase